MKYISDYQKKYPLEKRKEDSIKLRNDYPSRVPIIIIIDPKAKIAIDKMKYLAPEEQTLGHFMSIIRKRISVDSTESIFFFIEDKIVPNNEYLIDVYDKYKSEDGFLYIVIAKESCFGK